MALACLGLFLLAATQPWLSTVLESAPGAPRTRGSAAGGELVPWAIASALAATVAALAAMASSGRPRTRAGVLLLAWLGGAAALAGVASVVTTLALGLPGRTGGWLGAGGRLGAGSLGVTPAPGQVVSVASTGWLWVCLVTALIAVVALSWALLPSASAAHGPKPDAVRPWADLDPDERERRRVELAWRQLSEGQDPTDLP
ncbi:MAG: Trp biosynthesis-associated membrane protein [Ornithinimicrobium sp.]|nr:Trp biosynthesis-associated membrane protein [Ornithinimicrobium sp.]MDO5738714.1 Trp biosynthesis-associated membrane protein [Ornithinimicrobium sp.]